MLNLQSLSRPKPNKVRNWNKELPAVFKMIQDGVSTQKIADHYGINKQALVTAINNRGYSIKDIRKQSGNKNQPLSKHSKLEMRVADLEQEVADLKAKLK